MNNEPKDTIARLGLSVKARFIPFSQSRNKGEKNKTLNWSATLVRNGRDIITTDYSAGIAHCPGYASNVVPVSFQPHGYKSHNGKPYAGTSSAYRSATKGESLAQYRESLAHAECESGFPMTLDPYGHGRENSFRVKSKSERIQPDSESVIYSLVMDSDVLDSGGFENWASEFGYDTDSRSAESIYRACLDIALKLRAGIGESALAELREAFQDY